MRHRDDGQLDRILLVVVAVFLGVGILMVFSASSFRGAEKYGDAAFFIKLHLVRVVLGILLFLGFSRMDYHRFRWATPLALLLCLGLLVGVLLGPEFQGSRRSFFVLGKQFQPSEFTKLVVILYLAAVFAKGEKSRAHQGDVLSVHYIIVLVAVGLVFIEPDLGTALVLFSVSFSMFLLAGVAWTKLAKMGLLLVPLISVGVAVFPYQRQRISDFLSSVFGSGPMSYQVKQSIMGLAHGGLTGAGYGGGKQKLFFLPEPFSDFIFASLGEELGFIGIFCIMILLGLILWRGIRIALRAPDRYGYLVAGGITIMILVSALINAGVILNLLPTTGLPFPFLSYGGSSLIIHMIGAGILLNISRKSVGSYGRTPSDRGRGKLWVRGER